jgi:hypothetical protein
MRRPPIGMIAILQSREDRAATDRDRPLLAVLRRSEMNKMRGWYALESSRPGCKILAGCC